MFRSIKRFLIAATAIVVMSAPSAAYALIPTGEGPATTGQAQLSISPSVPRATASSSQGFQWGDAGVGAAAMIVLLGGGAGAAGVMRHRRVYPPIAG